MRHNSECREEILADLHLALLRIVYPEFRFSVEIRRAGRYRWVAVRRNIAVGMHAVVTDDLDELLAVLGPADLSCQPVPGTRFACGAAEASGTGSEGMVS